MSMTTPNEAPISMDALIGERVHQLMWRAQMTQTALAPRLGLTQAGLSPKLRGRRGWGTDELVTVARIFGVSVGYLFGEGGDTGSNLQPSDYMAAVSAEVIDLASRRASA